MTAAITSKHPLACQSWEYEKPLPGGIVAAIDGSAESIAALNTAAAIARTRRTPLHAVTVIAPFASYRINPVVDESGESAESLRVAIKDSELRVLLHALEAEDSWTHEVLTGRPARWIGSVAERRGADLIVMGRGHHALMDRVLGNETNLQVMRTSQIPVLSVSSDIGKPKSIVVAVDFSASSIEAAGVALDLLNGSGTLHLVYVEPALTSGQERSGHQRFPGDVVVWFRRLISGLSPRHGIHVAPVVLNGAPVAAINAFAERVGADLIAAGSHGHNKLERFPLGSVSTALVREAPCGVLVVPPSM